MSQQAQIQQILNERAVFQSAYQSGKINTSQYNEAMQLNANQLSGLGYSVQAISTPAPRPSPDFIGPMPSKISSFEATPKLTSNQSNALDLAKSQANTLTNFQLGSNTRQGTSPTGPTIAQITENLNAEDKAAFNQWQNQKTVSAMVNLGLFMGSAAVAPVLGPVAAVESAGLGLGITQGVKTASVAIQGGNIQNSILTPAEALEAAETGVLFSGVSKGVMVGITRLAPQAIAETVSGQGVKSVLARASVNAGIGATASYALSGGNPKAAIEGAAFGGLFSFGSEALGIGAAKINAKFDIAPRIFGVKAQELIGVSEIEKQVLIGNEIKINRLTQLQTDTVKLSYKEANVYKNLLGEYSKPRILLGGTEKVAVLSEGERTFGFRTSEANRSAQPVIEALKGSPFKMKELRMGKLSKFVETPSADLATQKTEVLTGFKYVKGKARIPEIKATKLIKTLKEPIVPQEKLTIREFSGIQITAKLDNGKYSKFEDLLQPNSKAIKFENKPLKEPMKPLGNSIGSKKPSIEVPKTPQNTNGEYYTIQKEAKAQVKTITLPKNIVKVGNPIRANFGSMIAPNVTQQEDYEHLSFPGQSFRTDLRITPKLTLTQKPMLNQKSNLQQVPKVMPFTLPKETTNTQSGIIPRQQPITTPKLTPILTPKITSRVTSQTIAAVTVPTIPKNRVFSVPAFSLGGGSGSSGGSKSFGAAWYQKKHKVKTYSQMLNTFGLGKAAKPMRSVEKSANKMIKTFNQKPANPFKKKSSVNRRKNKRR